MTERSEYIADQLRLRGQRQCVDGYAVPFDSELDIEAAAEITTLRTALASATKERNEACAYLKAFVAATVDPEDRRLDVQLHQANPTLGWVFTLNDTGMRGVRQMLGSQIRRAMEIVGFDKLKIEPARTTVADDHIKAVRDLAAAEAITLAATAESDTLREALARAQAWHESEDKALSKSGRNDADYHWRRLQHREQLNAIRAALPTAQYDAAWDRINSRAPAADDEPS